ncbi:MAG: AzlC family ABC transporter permease [Clostridia bacterium]|nr:AzlC family ABC transporter permease [Clostridia bacterium]
MNENNSFKSGLKDGLPICLGYLAVSFAFGIYAICSGLSVPEAAMISLFNVTSAGQLAAVPIIVSGGSIIELIFTQLVINARYALMSISLSQKLSPSVSRADRFIISFANTDEVFAAAISRKAHVGRRYMFGLILLPVIGWTFGTLFGAIAGNVLPEVLVASLGIAIYAMLTAVVIPAAREKLSVLIAALISVALSCALYFIPALSVIPSGFGIIIIAIAVSAIMSLLSPVESEEADENA